ncbi:MAG: TIGR00341 family protein [Planctomycetes bacterium]|nr:TIGR00341 family protein [Planctomycetota bacterium]
MVCPEPKRLEVEQLVQAHQPLGLWHDQFLDGQVLVRILLPAEQAESVLDDLESNYAGMEGFRILLIPVQAAIPRPDYTEEPAKEAPFEGAPKHLPTRISRHELYADISASAKLTRVYIAMILLSTMVAAIGMWRDNLAVVIGAMVIAPLLGPNMAFAFASTLGDGKLARSAAKTNLAGVAFSLGVSIAIGIMLSLGPSPIGPGIHVLAQRSEVCLADVALALAAGSAGALAFTTGISTALVGVMVAVALLPPLVAFGLTLGAARWGMALSAGLLFATNLVCVNLAAVTTFLFQGIHPRTWWKADKARKASRNALIIWVSLLLTLVALIILAQHWLRTAPGP